MGYSLPQKIVFFESLPPLEHLGNLGCVFWESVIKRVYIVEMSKDNRENTANPGNERIQNFSKEICIPERET
jgi:hypothetical protein